MAKDSGLAGCDSGGFTAGRFALRPVSPAGPRSDARWPAELPDLRISMRIRMLVCMRTTVVLDDELVKKAKKRAAELRTTLSEVINQALREAVARPISKKTDFKMIVFGGGPTRDYEP